MTDPDFFAAMAVGIPPITPPIRIGLDLAAGTDTAVVAEVAADGTITRMATLPRNRAMDKPTYSWSFDEETYHGHFGSIDEAMKAAFDREVRIADAGELRPGVHIGESEPFHPSSLLDADAFIDWAQTQMYDELGEASEDFLGSITAEQKQELINVLADWISRADAGSNYWKIVNSSFHRFADYGLRQEAE